MNSENFINVFIWGIVAIVVYEVFQARSQAALINASGAAPGSPGLTNELQLILNNVPGYTSNGAAVSPGASTVPAGFTYNDNSMNAAAGVTSNNPYGDPTWTY